MTIHSTQRIPALDGVRGLAIALVLIWHYVICIIKTEPGSIFSYVLALGRLTWSGVDLFFVLSGFLIGGILIDRRDTRNYFRAFYTHRCFRIIPLYLAFLLSMIIASAFIDNKWLFGNLMPLPSYMTFTQNMFMSASNNMGGNYLGITWSLAIEEQFYVTLPLLVIIIPCHRLIPCLCGLIIFAMVVRCCIYSLVQDSTVATYTMMPCRADALMIGVLLATIVRDGRIFELARARRNLLKLIFVFLMLGFSVFTMRGQSIGSPIMSTIGYSWLALLYGVLLLLSVSAEHSSRLSQVITLYPLRQLGSLAYGIYLFHQPILGIIHHLNGNSEPVLKGTNDIVATAAALATTITLAALSWRYFEKPILAYGYRTQYENNCAAL